MSTEALHEDLRREDEVLGPSDRSFGLTFAAFFTLLAAFSWWRDGDRTVLLAVLAAGFLTVALVWPALLRPLNRLWLRIGLLLHRVVNPAIMGLIFFLVVTPLGLLMRAFGAGGFERVLDPERESYWHKRHDREPIEITMRRQF